MIEETVKDIEDKAFWKALYSQLLLFFLCWKYCYNDSYIPLMDKIFSLVQRVDDSLLKLHTILNDKNLWTIKRCSHQNCEVKSTKKFEESYTEKKDMLLRFAYLFTILNFEFSVDFLVMMTMKLPLEMQYVMYGSGGRIAFSAHMVSLFVPSYKTLKLQLTVQNE